MIDYKVNETWMVIIYVHTYINDKSYLYIVDDYVGAVVLK